MIKPYLPDISLVVENHVLPRWGSFSIKLNDSPEGNAHEGSLSDFPGGPVVKTLCFHCRGHKFDPWSRN